MSDSIGIVDIFAGPGGLGEGFSAAGREDGGSMSIRMSVENDGHAFETLRLRAFLRAFDDGFPDKYYEAIKNGDHLPDWAEAYPHEWSKATSETHHMTLGKPATSRKIGPMLDAFREEHHGTTVLIGGPPCQAYSLVGRARNRGIVGYDPADDHRHFLYRSYVRILERLRPAAFVMENVKGMLSSEAGGGPIFARVLNV